MSFIQTYGGNLQTMANSGLKAVNKARAAGLSDLEILQIGRNEGISWGSGAQASLINGVTNQQNSRYDNLERQIADQQKQYQRSFDAFQQQAQRQQELYQQQIQQYQNQANAYVPPSEASAQDDSKGAMQTPATGTKRLSSLAIIEGLGTNANPLSGLQLA